MSEQKELRLIERQNTKRKSADSEQFILRNLVLSNRQLAEHTDLTINQVKHFLQEQNIHRNKEQIEQIYFRNGQNELGDKNPNWRSGSSKDFVRYKHIQMERYPERVKARQLVNQAYRAGKIKKLDSCEICSATEDLHFHHEDYSKPLEVKTTCRKCNEKLKHYTWNELKNFYKNNNDIKVSC